MTDESKSGWALLHSKLPPAAIRPLSKDVYGVEGLSDVNEAYLIQRLFASGLTWEWLLGDLAYLGAEDRQVRGKDYTTRYYLAAVKGTLMIDGRRFEGAGASDNRKLDAAFKGAATVAFKNASKLAALSIELFKDGRAMDFIYEDRQGNILPSGEIAPAAATAASREAMQAEAGKGAAKPVSSPVGAQDSPIATNIPSQANAPANAPSAPSVPRGPRAKRGNVIQAPKAEAVKPTAQEPVSPAATSKAAPVPQASGSGSTPPPVTLDDGQAVYLDTLRTSARELAAKLLVLRVTETNQKNAEAIALGNVRAVPMPPAAANPEADHALADYISRAYPNRALSQLSVEELTERIGGMEKLVAERSA